MALDLHQNFVSAQYLENKLTDFHQILYMIIHLIGLGHLTKMAATSIYGKTKYVSL